MFSFSVKSCMKYLCIFKSLICLEYPGSKIRIENGITTEWLRVENNFEDKYLDGTYAPHGLRLVRVRSKSPILQLEFKPVLDSDDTTLSAQCQLDHPFFVKDKGSRKTKPFNRCRPDIFCNALPALFMQRTEPVDNVIINFLVFSKIQRVLL